MECRSVLLPLWSRAACRRSHGSKLPDSIVLEIINNIRTINRLFKYPPLEFLVCLLYKPSKAAIWIIDRILDKPMLDGVQMNIVQPRQI